MPIRLNLLAEVQAAEDMRRRDPVKRAIWMGAFLVACMLTWSSFVWAKTMVANRALSKIENDMSKHSDEHRAVTENRKKVEDAPEKLAQLRKLTTSRFLNANLLNALQETTVDDVQLTHLAVKQDYFLSDEVKGKTNAADGKVSGYKAPTVRETIVLTLEAKDSGLIPGDQVNPYKDTISTNAYFIASLGRTNEIRLISVSPPNPASPTDPRPFRTFTFECRYPEKTR